MSVRHPVKAAAPEAKRASPRWKVVAQGERTAERRPAADHIPLAQLRSLAPPAVEQVPLPHAAELADLFAGSLPEVEVCTGPLVEAALDREGAEAATGDGVLYLRRDAPLPVIAHELTHVLQGRQPGDPQLSAEEEAGRAEWRAMQGEALPPVLAGLAPGALAFRALGAPAAPPVSGSAPPGTAPAPPRPTPAAVRSGGAEAASAPAAPAAPVAASPRLEAAPAPDVDADAATAGADAALAALAALDAAEDADAVLAAFAAAPPSVKASEAAGLGARVEAASARARAAEEAALPDLEARMTPGEALPEAPPVRAPAAGVGALEAAAPPPPPLPQLAPTPDPGRAAANGALGAWFERDFAPGDQRGLQRALGGVTTSDAAVDSAAGERPAVPLEGQSDPARIDDQQQAAATQADAARQGAMQAVLDGPGPERAQLREMAESIALPAAAPGEPAAMAAVASAAAFAAKPLDAATVAMFDRAHAPAMEASLAAANDEMRAAAATREQDRAAELAHAEEEQARLNRDADERQRDEVIARRADIQQARQQTLDEQAAEANDLRAEAATARATARADVEAEVSRTEAQIDSDFAEAEARAEAEVAGGEREAGAARDAAAREADNASWWDRAVNWVKQQLDRLTAAINAIFDAVRAAVRAIIDTVKEAALALIDAAAGLLKGIIEAFGALLHELVDRLLADVFPELAAALNAAIDAAVEAATAMIDDIAATLKAAVEFLAAALAAALDAVLAAWQAAANAALTLAAAALTGDWAALARLILTPILQALGIDPDSFFQMFERAAQALDSIVDDPSGFVGNLLETVKGGVRKFADNFPHHLVSGIILWLAGPLGSGLQMPAQFDLYGLLDVARQVAGLTLETVRRVAVRVLGESAVEKIEVVLRYIGALVTGGWSGLWEQLSSDLAMLRDLVLGQIKDFLLEKVVMASVLWLASMFNPVGALVKLVMTIWNFIQFLRAQLARILAVAQTVVNSMWQIATGALEPPILGIERVLAGLLPVVLDLLARLIGVTGVPEKVQKILGGVRAKIEAALEKLMRRVLAAFGVRGEGDRQGAAPGEIMAPIPFRGGGESHTILIEDEGETVRPMIRSTPTPLAAWLDQRPGQPFTDLAASRNWRGVVLANKRAELLALVAAARAEEAGLDARAEAAEDALNAAAAADATEAAKAAATAKVAATQSKGEQTKSAIQQVLEFFGIAIVPLDEKFAAEIGAMAPELQGNLRRQLLPRLDVARYTPLDWGGFGAMLVGDGAATEAWRRPASSIGAARRFTSNQFDQKIREKAAKLAEDNNLSFDAARMDEFYGSQLARRLNGRAALIVGHLLGGGGPDCGALATLLETDIKEALVAMQDGGDRHDHAFDRVTGSYFKAEIVGRFHQLLGSASWGAYFHDDAENAAGSGAGGAQQGIGFFLHGDPAGKAGSKRAAKNGQRLADAVRGADPGQHEWVASRFAATIIRNAANDVAQGRTDTLDGLSQLLRFQHIVRTPTPKLIFRPDGPYPSPKVVIRYQAYGHRMDAAFAGTAEALLADAERQLWYPPDRLHQGDAVEILQGHPGAVYARVSDGAPAAAIKPQTVGHGKWDEALAATISTELADGRVEFQEVSRMGDSILRFYRETIWDGGGLAAGNALYDEYFNSGGGSERASALAGSVGGYFRGYADELERQLDQVRGA